MVSEWVDYKEALALTGKTAPTIYRWAKERKVEMRTDGGIRKFKKSQLVDLAKSSNRGRKARIRNVALVVYRQLSSSDFSEILAEPGVQSAGTLLLFSEAENEVSDCLCSFFSVWLKARVERVSGSPTFNDELKVYRDRKYFLAANKATAEKIVSAMLDAEAKEAGHSLEDWLAEVAKQDGKLTEVLSVADADFKALNEVGLFVFNHPNDFVSGPFSGEAERVEHLEQLDGLEAELQFAVECFLSSFWNYVCSQETNVETDSAIKEALEVVKNLKLDYGFNVLSLPDLTKLIDGEISESDAEGLKYELALAFVENSK